MQVPARFEYETAASVEEAIELLREHGPYAHLMAGGHSLIPMMELRLTAPEMVIDIHELDGELRYIREEGGALDPWPESHRSWTRLPPSPNYSASGSSVFGELYQQVSSIMGNYCRSPLSSTRLRRSHTSYWRRLLNQAYTDARS